MTPQQRIAAGVERIAFRSTQSETPPLKARWTEIAVWHAAQPAEERSRFSMTVVGRSSIAGEEDRSSFHSAATLQELFATVWGNPDDVRSKPARAIMVEAAAWAINRAAAPWAARSVRPAGTYSDAQREAAIDLLFNRLSVGFTREHVAVDVDCVAAALGLRRETARG